jgi:hypothetical protein
MNADTTQKVLKYWLACLKEEDFLQQKLTIRNSSNCIFNPFDFDPFITSNEEVIVQCRTSQNLHSLLFASSISKKFLCYGYPLVYLPAIYNKTKLSFVPLFMVKVEVKESVESVSLAHFP